MFEKWPLRYFVDTKVRRAPATFDNRLATLEVWEALSNGVQGEARQRSAAHS